METLRNLKIKTSTCKRIVKEMHSYEKEVEREAAKTADMKEKGADPYDLKQQMFQLLLAAYSTISIQDASLFLGMNEDDATNCKFLVFLVLQTVFNNKHSTISIQHWPRFLVGFKFEKRFYFYFYFFFICI
ncbi:hypothetical protein HYC85_001981 [Camellia sinensis]|uniref:Tubulin-specific chaperone A n=1 Tax=Camellia sinensis TaxID=4442 RepID=A0A7J7I6W3_CAMSI|nr:hypothetical protein HYC85_001981 [Camellia sinensis]